MEKYKGIIILLIVAVGLILMIPASIVIFYVCCGVMQVAAWVFGVSMAGSR